MTENNSLRREGYLECVLNSNYVKQQVLKGKIEVLEEPIV